MRLSFPRPSQQASEESPTEARAKMRKKTQARHRSLKRHRSSNDLQRRIGASKTAARWPQAYLLNPGSCTGHELRCDRNAADSSYEALRRRMIEPNGRCASSPCHGLNDMPSSIALERSALQPACGGTSMRATAT